MKEEYGGVDIKRWVTMLDMHGIAKSLNLKEDQKKVLHNDRVFPITNLERMYDAKEVRDFSRIDIDSDGKLVGKTDKEEFKKRYKKIIKDVIDGKIDSTSMSNSTSRKSYLKGFDKEYTPNTDKDQFFTADFFDEIQIEFDKEKHLKKYRKQRRSRGTPKGLIPGYISINLKNSSLYDLFKELKKVNVKKCPNATAVLFCSFLERSLLSFSLKLVFLVKVIEAAKRNKPQVTKLYTTYFMHAVKHNKDFSVSDDQVRSTWKNFEGLMKII